MNLIGAVLGAGFAAGLILLVGGLRLRNGGASPGGPPPGPREVADFRRRAAVALAGAGPVAVATRWPVAAVGVGTVGWFSRELFGSRAARDRGTAKTEAIAAWTEMLRDTIAGAHGIEESITATATVAPLPIRDEVTALAARIEREPLDAALRALAVELAHPTADLVVTSLALAARGAVGDLGELLGSLAAAARQEAGMRLEVEAARSRLRTSVRVISACTIAMAVGLVLLNPTYVEVYASTSGQVVLGGVTVLWGGALWWLARMGEFTAPERFLAVPEPGDPR